MFIKAVRDGVEIFPLIIFIFMTKIFTLRIRTMIGGWLMSWLVRVNHNLNSRILRNLELTMPQKNKAEKKKFIKKLGWFIGATFTELIFNSELQKNKSRFKYSQKDLEPLIKANKEGRPIIIVSAHFGCWEAIRAVLKLHGLTSGAIYKKNKNQFYETLHLRAIKSGGEPIFSTGFHGTKKMIEHLKMGGIVAIMLDQAVQDGEFFDFLGVPAKTTTSVAKIAIKLNALVVPSYGIRSVKKNIINVHFEEPIIISDYRMITAELTRSIEKRVKLNPEQWYWLHRRWKY